MAGPRVPRDGTQTRSLGLREEAGGLDSRSEGGWGPGLLGLKEEAGGPGLLDLRKARA